jgi:hypothetical protein
MALSYMSRFSRVNGPRVTLPMEHVIPRWLQPLISPKRMSRCATRFALRRGIEVNLAAYRATCEIACFKRG